MSARLLEGKVFAGQFKEDAKTRADRLEEKYGVRPGLAVIIVGHDPASEVYVRNKHKACEELGIYSEVIEMPEESTKEEILARIDSLNKDRKSTASWCSCPCPRLCALPKRKSWTALTR